MTEERKNIKIKPSYKRRAPHLPTKVHKSKKKYTRKGKAKNIKTKEIRLEQEDG